MEWEWSDSAGCLACPLCQQPGFPSLEVLLRALQALTSGQPSCAVCGERLPDLAAYLRHLADHAPSWAVPPLPAAPAAVPAQQLYLHCPRCPKKFKTARGRASHVRSKHGAEDSAAAAGGTSVGLLVGDAALAPAEPASVSVQAEATDTPGRLTGQWVACRDQTESHPCSNGGPMDDSLALMDYCLTSGGQDSASLGRLSTFETQISAGQPFSSQSRASSNQDQLLMSPGQPLSPQDQPATTPGHLTSSQSLPSLGPGHMLSAQSLPSQNHPQHQPLSPPDPLFTSQHQPLPSPTDMFTSRHQPLPSPTDTFTSQHQPLPSPTDRFTSQHQPLPSPTDIFACPSQPPPAQQTPLSPPSAGADPSWGGLARRPDGGRRLRRLLQASHACQDCGRVFRLRPGLEAHRRLAHGDGACEQCGVCQRRFSSSRRLQRHLATHSVHTDSASALDGKSKETATFECPTCKKTFTTGQFLKKHVKLHTGETPYVCDVCGRGFALQQSYHKHQQYHTALRPYPCPQCGRAFRESATLQNHMRIHSGEKPWTCETCGRSFRQRITYVVHRRLHTGVLPYTCSLCHAGFRYKLNACGG